MEGYSAVLVVDEAIHWLKEKRDKSKPFFLAVWTHEPHLPIETDPAFQEPYAKFADPDTRQHHGNVTQLDHAFGKLMKSLDEQKLAQSTFVFFTSDNGPEGDGLNGRTRGSTGGFRGRKRALYEGGIRVAGLARWPGHIKPSSTCDDPIIGSDLFPTILGVAGIKVPTDRVLDGVDVRPALVGNGTVDRPVPLYWRLQMAPHGLHIAMRQGDWKILASDDLTKMELYNLKSDPKETTDLREREPERFEKLRKELTSLNKAIEAEGPDWWKRLSPNGGGPRKPKP
jgi:arylsulfatase A